uniref:DUF1598 domain-containing protein n=1 Tax=Schlesneria paludicola TaxID=360056 RepID=A0A7C4LQ24_9PLAN
MRSHLPGLACALIACVWAATTLAQPPGGGGVGNQNPNVGGITIDAEGLVRPGFLADQSSRLDRKRRQALAEKQLPAEANVFSACRKVSLPELERFVAAKLERGEPLADEVLCLAGLQRIEYLFVDPDRQDLVIAGPAEGFARDEGGRPRGVSTGRPTLLLDDLLVALRFVPQASEVGCSIDPQPANLAALQQFVARHSTPATPQVIEARYRKMAEILGRHDVRVDGVPADSHFGRTLVEADYRMKLISLGLEQPLKGLRSHLSMVAAGSNSIQRWWFVPYYEGLYRSEDGLAYELVGQRAQLLSQDEVANASGDRFAAAVTQLSTQAFARQFTEKFAALADESPVFAELQNLIDWCVVAALIEREQLAVKVGWKRELFLDAARLPYQSGPAPRQTPAVFNTRRASAGMVVGLLSGGVTIVPRKLAQPAAFQTDVARRLVGVRNEELSAPRSKTHPWWWD